MQFAETLVVFVQGHRAGSIAGFLPVVAKALVQQGVAKFCAPDGSVASVAPGSTGDVCCCPDRAG